MCVCCVCVCVYVCVCVRVCKGGDGHVGAAALFRWLGSHTAGINSY